MQELTCSQWDLLTRAAEYDRLTDVRQQLEVVHNPHKEKPHQRKKLWDRLDRALEQQRHGRPAGIQVGELTRTFGRPEVQQVSPEEWAERMAKREKASKRMRELRERRTEQTGGYR